MAIYAISWISGRRVFFALLLLFSRFLGIEITCCAYFEADFNMMLLGRSVEQRADGTDGQSVFTYDMTDIFRCQLHTE